ncbi:AI-2E family transporter [bacterium]|nr:MAG: AI-2E family transporter [bacterium]
MSMKFLTIERVLKTLFVVGVVITLTFLMVTYSTIVIYTLIAVVLSYVIEPIVNKIQAKGLPRVPAILISMNVVLLLLIWVFTSVFPSVIGQIINLAQQLNIPNVQAIATKIETRVIEVIPFLPAGFLRDAAVNLLTKVFEFGGLQDTISQVLNVFTNVFYAVLIIPFSTFFFLKDGSNFRRKVLEWVPNDYFEMTLTILSKIEYRLVQYFKSVGLQSLFVGLLSWILLSLFGFKNALAIAVVTGVANTIPYFGPVMGYVLAIIVAIFETGNFDLVLFGVLAIFITQVVDNIVFQPVLFSKSADLHPVLILFAVLVGAETAGIVGMLMAIPLATTLKILIREISKSLNRYHVFRVRNT